MYFWLNTRCICLTVHSERHFEVGHLWLKELVVNFRIFSSHGLKWTLGGPNLGLKDRYQAVFLIEDILVMQFLLI